VSSFAETRPIIRLDLKEILEEDGYEVVGGDGRAAISHRARARAAPRLAIPRHQDARNGGLTAARHIATSGWPVLNPHRVLAARPRRAERGDAGALAYLVKPFQKSDSIPAIEMALGRHEQLVALERENNDLANGSKRASSPTARKGRLMESTR